MYKGGFVGGNCIVLLCVQRGRGAFRAVDYTTGQTTKTAARNFCNCLNRLGKLFPDPKYVPTFEEYALGFWDWEKSGYLKDRRRRHKLTQSYADKNKRVIDFTLLPYFGKMRLDKITADKIEKWFDHMIGIDYPRNVMNNFIRGA